jgi:hypothetical protein
MSAAFLASMAAPAIASDILVCVRVCCASGYLLPSEMKVFDVFPPALDSDDSE